VAVELTNSFGLAIRSATTPSPLFFGCRPTDCGWLWTRLFQALFRELLNRFENRAQIYLRRRYLNPSQRIGSAPLGCPASRLIGFVGAAGRPARCWAMHGGLICTDGLVLRTRDGIPAVRQSSASVVSMGTLGPAISRTVATKRRDEHWSSLEQLILPWQGCNRERGEQATSPDISHHIWPAVRRPRQSDRGTAPTRMRGHWSA